MKKKKEIALKHKAEEEKRIEEENRRIKEWERKFDEEQKIKEEELIKKFYSDNEQKSDEINANVNEKTDPDSENKNN